MAYKQSIVIVVALLLLAVATPLAYGQTVNVTGRICCTSNGNCPPASAGVQGVPVNMNCITSLKGEVMLNQGTTGEDGQISIGIPYNITISNEEPLFTPRCVASVNLPLNSPNCPALTTAVGILVSIAQLQNAVITAPLSAWSRNIF